MQERPTLPTILSIGALTLSLLLASIVGAVYVGGQDSDQQLATDSESSGDLGDFGVGGDEGEPQVLEDGTISSRTAPSRQLTAPPYPGRPVALRPAAPEAAALPRVSRLHPAGPVIARE